MEAASERFVFVVIVVIVVFVVIIVIFVIVVMVVIVVFIISHTLAGSLSAPGAWRVEKSL